MLIGAVGSSHLDGQQVALRINQDVPFATHTFFSHIVALFRATRRAGCDGLAIDDRGTGLGIAALLGTHLETKRRQYVIPDTSVSPATKVPVDGAPGRQIVGQQSPGTAAAQDVQNGIDDLPPLTPVLMIGADCSLFTFADLYTKLGMASSRDHLAQKSANASLQ